MLEVIRTIEALQALAPEWDDLCSRTPQATVFQKPSGCCRGGGISEAAILRPPFCGERGELQAVAPMFLHGMPGQQIRQLSFIGSGITDYMDFIVTPEAFTSFPGLVRGLSTIAARSGTL